MRLSE